ncbi:hypothetical protein [Desulfovibrio sp. X2]|uniref:hypothetical protein n=1 Tax=Desulfovibrio sp. X2 TaxID=941449 RepID=UPI00126940E9|nr:hypothetical protein [Desulfovibrio sp. X2]
MPKQTADRTPRPTDGPAAESEAEEIARLEAEIADFERDAAACEAEARRLLAEEDPAAGIFHARAIHEARLAKMRLFTEAQFRRVRVNRLRQGIVESAPPNIGRGFPF